MLGAGCNSREKQKKRLRDKISLPFRNDPFAYWKTLRDIGRRFRRITELRREKSYHKGSRKQLFQAKYPVWGDIEQIGASHFQEYRQNLKEHKSEALRWIPLDLRQGWFASKRSLWDAWWTVPRNTETESGKVCVSDAYKEVAASNSWSEVRKVQEDHWLFSLLSRLLRQDAALTF